MLKIESDTRRAAELELRNTNEQQCNIVGLNVSNVVCTFGTKCSLNLKRIATQGMNVELRRDQNVILMKLRKPSVTARIFSSGKITCIGATSRAEAYTAARRLTRIIQKLHFKAKLTNFRIVNVLASCSVPFSIDLAKLAQNHMRECVYEPELHPGAVFKMNDLKSSITLYANGNITLTANCVDNIHISTSRIYDILLKFKFITQDPVVDESSSSINNNNNNNDNQPICLDNTINISDINHESSKNYHFKQNEIVSYSMGTVVGDNNDFNTIKDNFLSNDFLTNVYDSLLSFDFSASDFNGKFTNTNEIYSDPFDFRSHHNHCHHNFSHSNSFHNLLQDNLMLETVNYDEFLP